MGGRGIRQPFLEATDPLVYSTVTLPAAVYSRGCLTGKVLKGCPQRFEGRHRVFAARSATMLLTQGAVSHHGEDGSSGYFGGEQSNHVAAAQR